VSPVARIPRNCRINRGYLEARIYYQGRKYSNILALIVPKPEPPPTIGSMRKGI